MINRRVASPAKLWHDAMIRAQPDQPTEQADKYLALGSRWISHEEGNIPTRAC